MNLRAILEGVNNEIQDIKWSEEGGGGGGVSECRSGKGLLLLLHYVRKKAAKVLSQVNSMFLSESYSDAQMHEISFPEDCTLHSAVQR